MQHNICMLSMYLMNWISDKIIRKGFYVPRSQLYILLNKFIHTMFTLVVCIHELAFICTNFQVVILVFTDITIISI